MASLPSLTTTKGGRPSHFAATFRCETEIKGVLDSSSVVQKHVPLTPDVLHGHRTPKILSANQAHVRPTQTLLRSSYPFSRSPIQSGFPIPVWFSSAAPANALPRVAHHFVQKHD
mmetsp:Transcript_37883/g.80207  ORF Transcript_37883/g.80207 Transcript_37883/m.80207 type:complete len:115 (-) Transcript_37883:91-435(-)